MSSPVTIQPSTIDNYLSESAPTTNYGTAAYFYVRRTTRLSTAITFDFSASVPTGAVITSAILYLYCYQVAANRTITVYRLLRTTWHETQSTYNIFSTGNNWGTAGALGSGVDFTPTDAVTAASLSAAGWQQWTVTAQVQTALDSVAGVTHFLVADVGAASGSYQTYRSREYTGDTTLRPKLYIEYTVPSAVKPNFLPFFWA